MHGPTGDWPGPEPQTLVVRPDGLIGLRARGHDPDAVRAYFAGLGTHGIGGATEGR